MTTADFVWPYDPTPGQNFIGPAFVAATSALEAYLNGLKARLDVLDGGVAAANYVTRAELNSHVASPDPHAQVLRLDAGSALVGNPTPTTHVVVQTWTLASPAQPSLGVDAPATPTVFPVPFSNGVFLVTGSIGPSTDFSGGIVASSSLLVSTVSLTGCYVQNAAGVASVTMMAIGW